MTESPASTPPTSADTEAELATLVEAGTGRWEDPPPGPRGGRPSRRFVLTGRPRPTDTTPPTVRQGGPEGRRAGVASVLSVSDEGGAAVASPGREAT